MKSRQRGFTLLELLLVIMIFSLLIGVVFTAYSRMIKLKSDVEARQNLIDRSYFLMERLQVMLADYTIDYEEYFNRKIVGCGNKEDIKKEGHCTKFTWYGNTENNGNSIPFACSSLDSGEEFVLSEKQCTTGRNQEPQPYGSYKLAFWDMGKDVDTIKGVMGDEDDKDMGDGPVAVVNNPQELYLKSYDGTRRLFLRRYVISGKDKDNNVEKTYGLQQLKLKGVDAGYEHKFSGSGAFDGKIDTRWCDAEEGYFCKGGLLGGKSKMLGLYRDKDYAFATGVNDGWVDVFGSDISVADWSITVTPNTDPKLAWADDEKQVAPSVRLNITTKLSPEKWSQKLGKVPVQSFSLPLQTTFGMKTFYR